MNIYDYILLTALALGVFFALRHIRRQKKRGGCGGCCGDCTRCGGCSAKK